MATFSNFLIRFGIPRELLAEVGVADKILKNKGNTTAPSYWHFLRSLPEREVGAWRGQP